MREATPLAALFCHAKISKGQTQLSDKDIKEAFNWADLIIKTGEDRERNYRKAQRITELQTEITKLKEWMAEAQLRNKQVPGSFSSNMIEDERLRLLRLEAELREYM